MLRRLLAPVALLVAASAVLSACASYSPPERIAPTALVPGPVDSEIVLSASVPLAEIQAAMTQLPPVIPVKGSANLVCAQLPHADGGGVVMQDSCADVPQCNTKGCTTVHTCVKLPKLVAPSVTLKPSCATYAWSAIVRPDGPAVVSRKGDLLHVEQPLHIEGDGAFTGDLSVVLPHDARHFDLRLRPGVDLAFDLSPQWCPVVNLTPTPNWVSSARVLVLPKTCTTLDLGALGKHPVCTGPADLDLTGVANANQKGMVDGINKALATTLACDKVRGQVAGLWRRTPVPLPEVAGEKAYLNLTPHTAALAHIGVDDDGLRFLARLGVQTQVSTTPAIPSPLPLPNLDRLTGAEGGLDLTVRGEASYEALKAALARQITGRGVSASTPAGPVVAQIVDFDLYPTGQSLTVGVKLKTRMPGRLLDDETWIYLTGEPAIAADGHSLAISSLRLSLVARNPGVLVLTTLFIGPVTAVLNTYGHYDLTDTLNGASTQLTNGITAAQIKGVSLSAGRPVLTLKRVAIDHDGVIADAQIRLPLTATLTRSLVAP